MKWLAVIVGLGIGIWAIYLFEDHQTFTEWAGRRSAWHERCDAYVGKTPAELGENLQAATTCRDQWLALLEEAKKQGWSATE